jgi:hypothetical protein
VVEHEMLIALDGVRLVLSRHVRVTTADSGFWPSDFDSWTSASRRRVDIFKDDCDVRRLWLRCSERRAHLVSMNEAYDS